MKVFKVFISLFLVFCMLFIFLFSWTNLYKEKENKDKSYSGIISLWQIDSFEGGFGSRKQFLLDTARLFERENKGALVMVTEHTKESAIKNIKNGQIPDMISYGTGMEAIGFNEIKLDNNFSGGKIGNKNFANVWCRGGFVLIYNPKLTDGTNKEINELLVSEKQVNLPLVAFALSGYSAKTIKIKPPLEAYITFLEGKTPYFLGTQRDIVRLENRGFNYGTISLEGYNDLYQYVSITATDTNKKNISEKFIEFLLSEKIQKNLNKISMCSVNYNVEFDNESLTRIQNTLYKSTISAFIPDYLFKDVKEYSFLASCGDENSMTKIKNVLILS